MENNNEVKEEVKVEVKTPKKKKTWLIILSIIIVLAIIGVTTFFLINGNKSTTKNEEKLKPLPLPEVTGGERGKLGIDKNINESVIDEYLNRSDSVYRDMRMFEDPAKYENIGGDRYLSGYVKGFEVVSLPYLIPVTGLPEEVGDTYLGKTLFDIDDDGKYIPNYEESMKIIEELFPKNKVIFLMCGGGGYAGMTKQFLVSLGWDETKIYVVGGYWYYNGKNNVSTKKIVDGKIVYDYESVPYHPIEFDKLKEIKREIKFPVKVDSKYYNYDHDKPMDLTKYHDFLLTDLYNQLMGATEEEEPAIQSKIDKKTTDMANTINQMLERKESFVLAVEAADFTCGGLSGGDAYANMITYDSEHNFLSYHIGLAVYKKTKLYDTIKYFPTVIIIYKGQPVAYVDQENNDHIKVNEDYNEFVKWFESHVNMNP